ncbi:MAG: ImmA/IrrE family metallo-endopeptidase [Pseudomonadota bacterium]
MVSIDRMDLEDVGDNPKRLAAAVVEQAGISSGHVPIREIAFASDIREIKRAPLISFEGALVTTPEKSVGTILVKEGVSEKRTRFTIAHELGHFLIGYHRPVDGRFECTSKDMNVRQFKPSDRAAKMEVEANRFAAELLMPRKIVVPWIKKIREIDLSQVLSLATDYRVSKEAAARRFVELIDEPVAIVFSKDGLVRYWLNNEDFPSLVLRPHSPLPEGTVSAKFQNSPGSISQTEEASQESWLRREVDGVLSEQVLLQRDGYRMTLLSCELEDVDDEDVWEAPRFRR